MSKVKHSRQVVEVRFKSQQPTLELAPSLQHRSSHLRRSHSSSRYFLLVFISMILKIQTYSFLSFKI